MGVGGGCLPLAEIGMYKLEGSGKARIRFDQSFSGKPVFVSQTFGYLGVNIPFGGEIKVPTPCFQWSVNSAEAVFLNGFGTTYVSYMAFEV